MTTNNPQIATSSVETAAIRQRLQDLLDQCRQSGLNKNDQVETLITGCLEEGITEGRRIVGTVASLGFDIRHVGALLRSNIKHLWVRDRDRYALLPSQN